MLLKQKSPWTTCIKFCDDLGINLATSSAILEIDGAWLFPNRQFFDKSIVTTCKLLANLGKRVVVAGLEKDYLAKSFGSMPELLIDAEYITKVNAICINCGDPANFSHRISTEIKQVVVGETDKYEALCRRCYIDKTEDKE